MINLMEKQTFVTCSFYKKEVAFLEDLFKDSNLILNESSLKVSHKKFIFFIQNVPLSFVSIIHEFLSLCISLNLKLDIILRLISYKNSNKAIFFIDSVILSKVEPLIFNIFNCLKVNNVLKKFTINVIKSFIKFRYKSGFKKIRNSKCNFDLLCLLKIIHLKNSKFLCNIVQGESLFKNTIIKEKLVVTKSTIIKNAKNTTTNSNSNKKENSVENVSFIKSKKKSNNVTFKKVVNENTIIVNKINNTDCNLNNLNLNNVILDIQNNVKKLRICLNSLEKTYVVKKNDIFECVYNLTKQIYYDMNVFLNSEKLKNLLVLDILDSVQNEILKKVKNFLFFFKDYICTSSYGVIKNDKGNTIFTFKNLIDFEEFLLKEIKKKTESFTDQDFCYLFQKHLKSLNIFFCRAAVSQNMDFLMDFNITDNDIQFFFETLKEKKLFEFSKTFSACGLFIKSCYILHSSLFRFFVFAERTAPKRYKN